MKLYRVWLNNCGSEVMEYVEALNYATTHYMAGYSVRLERLN
jgi:hypothetical protein